MRTIQGYICRVRTPETTLVFGDNTRNGTGFAEALETNGIVPFASREEAARALLELKERVRGEVKTVRVLWLALSIAETEEEWRSIRSGSRRHKTYIVIVELEDDVIFLGAPSEKEGKTAYPLPGSFLWQNGWQPLTRFSAAKWTAMEAHRQAQAKTYIASFALLRLRPES